MQVDDRPTAEVRNKDMWRGPLIGIAAAAVILIGALAYFVTDREPVATPAPNATLLTLEMDFQPIESGAYYTDTDGDETTATRGTFVIESDGWTALAAGATREAPGGSIDGGTYVMLMVGELDQVWEAPCVGAAAVPAATTARALGDQFAAMPGFITVEGLAPVTAFGHDGYHLILEVPGACTASETYNVWRSKNWGERFYQAEGQIVEYWFLDVEGTTVMVEATRPPESTEEFTADLEADLDAVLNSLVITP